MNRPGKDAALILVDIQKGFDDPRRPSRNNPQAESNAARLLEAWRARSMPLWHVQHASTSPTSVLHPSSPGFPIKPEVAPLPGEPVVVKNVNSAFIGTDLEQRLRTAGIGKVVIAGLTTPHCISTSVRMAGNLGFETWVVSDATAAWSISGPDGRVYPAEDLHLSSLAALHDEFAVVIDTQQVLDSL